AEDRGIGAAIAWGAFVGLCHPFAGLALAIALFLGWVVRLFGRFEVTGWRLRLGILLVPVGVLSTALGGGRDLWWLGPAGVLPLVGAGVACAIGIDRGERLRWTKSRRVIGLAMMVAGFVASGLGVLVTGDNIVIASVVLLANGALAFAGVPRLVPL